MLASGPLNQQRPRVIRLVIKQYPRITKTAQPRQKAQKQAQSKKNLYQKNGITKPKNRL
jgi:hypothetical protein